MYYSTFAQGMQWGGGGVGGGKARVGDSNPSGFTMFSHLPYEGEA